VMDVSTTDQHSSCSTTTVWEVGRHWHMLLFGMRCRLHPPGDGQPAPLTSNPLWCCRRLRVCVCVCVVLSQSFIFDNVPAPNSKKGMMAAALIAAKRKKLLGIDGAAAAAAGSLGGSAAVSGAATVAAAAAEEDQGAAKRPAWTARVSARSTASSCMPLQKTACAVPFHCYLCHLACAWIVCKGLSLQDQLVCRGDTAGDVIVNVCPLLKAADAKMCCCRCLVCTGLRGCRGMPISW